jgi:hypothetical protein
MYIWNNISENSLQCWNPKSFVCFLLSIYDSNTKAQAYEKKITILFLVYFGNNKIHTIYKQTSVFVLSFSMLLFWFYYKAATTRNRQFIYNLSMLCTENNFFLIEVLDEFRLFIDEKVIFSEKTISVGLPSTVSITSIRTPFIG